MADKLEVIVPTIAPCHHEEVRNYLAKNGFIHTVWFLIESVWGPLTIQEAERDLKSRDESSVFYTLLYKEYNVEEHYKQTDSHKVWILKAYDRLKEFVPHMTLEHAKVHDLSKYDFVQAIGYTAKWVHNVDWGNETWQASLNDHYRRESHHPQFFPKGHRMTRKDLEESLVDMVASRWERQLGGNEKASNFDLVDFDPKFLLRYCPDDLTDVKALMEKVRMDDIAAYRWKLMEPLIPESKADVIRSFYKANGFIQTICHLFGSVWDQETIAQVEKGLKKRDPEYKYYQLLYIEFDVREHFSQADSHRAWVNKSYHRLKEFVPNVTQEIVDVHDLSKYNIAQAIGYTAKWVHMVEWGNQTWQASLSDHYKRESHHPQYFPEGDRMSRKCLEESLVDMVACRWERDLKGNEKASLFDLVDFHPNYLKRYCEEDFNDVTSLIKSIQNYSSNA